MMLPHGTCLCPRCRQRANQSVCHGLRLTTPDPSSPKLNGNSPSGRVLPSAQTPDSRIPHRPTPAHLHLWQQRTRSSCCTRSDRNWGRQRGRRILDSSSGRQGPLCSRSYLTQANAASKTCHDRQRKLRGQLFAARGHTLILPTSSPPLPLLRPSLGCSIFPISLLNPLFSLRFPSYPIRSSLLKRKPRLL